MKHQMTGDYHHLLKSASDQLSKLVRLLAETATISILACSLCFAVPLPGDENPDFLQYVETWLQGDDKTSLAGLASLAAGGSVAARLLLARIERYDRSPSSYISNLDRVEKLSLFRSKNETGPFYKSWVDIEARLNNPLAKALRATGYPQVNLELIEALRSMGEIQATDHPVRIASIYASTEQRSYLLKNKLVMEEMIPYLLSFKENPEAHSDGIEALRYIARNFSSDLANGNDLEIDDQEPDTRQAALYLALGLPYGDLNPDNRWFPVVSNWFLTAESIQPIADVCREKCDGEETQCALLLVGLTGGYYEAVRLDSPLESVISQRRFLKSPRARSMALRRASLTRAETNKELMSLEALKVRSQCTGRLVEKQRADRPFWDQYKN